MRILQVAGAEPCAMCMLVRQLAKMTRMERLVYAQHLRHRHSLKPYYIER